MTYEVLGKAFADLLGIFTDEVLHLSFDEWWQNEVL
jgi:hypothetical protein